MTPIKTQPIRRIVLGLGCVLALLAADPSEAEAGMANMDCTRPSIFPGAAVNVIVLPYDYVDASRNANATARQLAMLIQLDTLFSILKYGSIGAIHTIAEPSPGACAPDLVVDKLLGVKPGASVQLQPGQGLVVVWGHLYEEGNDLFVQSYVRFLRRDVSEELEIRIDESLFRARLPAQAIAFSPQHLTRDDIARIASAFSSAVVVHDQPSDSSPGRPAFAGSLGQREHSYYVDQADHPWMHIISKHGPSGWVRAATDARAWPLRRKLPELHFIEALVGYLQCRRMPDTKPRAFATQAAWVESALNEYQRASAGKGSPLAAAVSDSILGFLKMQGGRPTEAGLQQAQQHFEQAARRVPYNGAARNLAMMGNLCTVYWGSEASVKALSDRLGRPVARKSADDLIGAIALDERDDHLRQNLDSLYRLVEKTPPLDARLRQDQFRPEELRIRMEAARKVQVKARRPPR